MVACDWILLKTTNNCSNIDLPTKIRNSSPREYFYQKTKKYTFHENLPNLKKQACAITFSHIEITKCTIHLPINHSCNKKIKEQSLFSSFYQQSMNLKKCIKDFRKINFRALYSIDILSTNN